MLSVPDKLINNSDTPDSGVQVVANKLKRLNMSDRNFVSAWHSPCRFVCEQSDLSKLRFIE